MIDLREIIQFIGIIALFGLAAYAFFMSKRGHLKTFVIQGQRSLRSLALSATLLALNRLGALIDLYSIEIAYELSAIILLGFLIWIMAMTSKHGKF